MKRDKKKDGVTETEVPVERPRGAERMVHIKKREIAIELKTDRKK
jgi:hypothetical protein